MKLKNKNLNAADIEVSLDELLILNSALNEVCNGLDQFDFETRVGAPHSEVTILLQKVNSIIDEVESN